MLALKATKLHRIFKLMNIQNLSFVIKLIFEEHEKNNGQSESFFLKNRISLFSHFRINDKASIIIQVIDHAVFFSNKRSFNPLTNTSR